MRTKPLIIHLPHTSTYIPEEYRRTSLIPLDELEKENVFMCDTGLMDLIPPSLADCVLAFPYSRLYCDVERFPDARESMNARGMGFIYTRDSHGREMFRPTVTHREEVLQIYNAHHAELNRRARAALREHGRCLVVDLHSFSDETVTRLFGWTDFPDVCIGTEEEYYDKDLVNAISCLCRSVGLSVAMNYPYRGSMVPNQYYGKRGTGIVSVMLEINKRVLHGG